MATYKEQWGEAKKLFEKTAKVKKPSAKVDATFRKSPGIDKSLAALDKDLEGIKAIKKALTQNDLDKFKVTLDNFKVVKASYMLILNNTVGAEPNGTDKVAYQKGITVLKTRLDGVATN